MTATSGYLNKPLRAQTDIRWIVRTLEPNILYARDGRTGVEWTRDRDQATAYDRWTAKTIHDDTNETGRPCVREIAP